MRASHSLPTRIFVIGGLILFGAGLFFIGNRQKTFRRNFEVYAEFHLLNGLQKGALVRVSGMEAGEVLETQVPKQPDGKFRLKLRIQENLHSLVRADSVANIKTLGLAGNSFVDIQKGTSHAPESAPEATIPSLEPFDVTDLIRQGGGLVKQAQTTIDKLETTADRTLQSVNSAAHHTDQTVFAMRPDLQNVVASARKTSKDLTEVMAQVRQGKGTIGKLLIDQDLSSDVDRIAKDMRQSTLNLNEASVRMNQTMTDLQKRDLLGRAQAVLDNSRQATALLNQAVTNFTSSAPGDENAAANLRDAIASARTTMANLAADTEALQSNFLLRGFFKRRGYFNLNQMTPAQYRSNKFLKAHAYQRIALNASQLFPSQPQDPEQLTKQGERQVEDAMTSFVSSLPNTPIIVEGYASQGSPSERFIRAKQRASTVQTFLEKRFGLQPDMVGVMPLPDTLPTGAGGSVIDGVSIVLIR